MCPPENAKQSRHLCCTRKRKHVGLCGERTKFPSYHCKIIAADIELRAHDNRVSVKDK